MTPPDYTHANILKLPVLISFYISSLCYALCITMITTEMQWQTIHANTDQGLGPPKGEKI